MVSRAQLERFTDNIHRERKPEMAGLTGFHIEPDGSMLLEFDLAEARLQLAAEAQAKAEESAPKYLVALYQGTALAHPSSPHAR